jgi:hypothetical protein
MAKYPNYSDPKYRAAMEANMKLMGEHADDENGNTQRSKGMSALDEVAAESGFGSIEEMLKACENAKPVDEYQQQVLNAMRTRETYIILIFGPGHGQTMRLSGAPADEIVWQEAVEPIFYADKTGPTELLRDSRRGMHRYRLNDEMESAQMEEVAIYVHHEKCCEKRFDRDDTTARHMGRPAPDVFNKPYLRNPRR